MSWPTRTWTQDGWQDFRSPLAGSKPKGLPTDWEDHKKGVMGDSATFWDIIDNPLYEAAADACDIDWDEWKADSLAKVGSKEDYKVASEYADNQTPDKYKGMSPVVANMLGKGSNDYGNLTPEQQAIADQFPDRQSVGGVRGYGKDRAYGAGLGGIVAGVLSGESGKDLRDWGINRKAFGGINKELDEMSQWLKQTIKTHSLQDAPIIRRGPEGSDYGIDGDIWEHYGLDKPPAPPKTMDVNYDFNLLATKPSTKTYDTPSGYPQIDTSSESVPYKDTHYTKWQTEQDKAHDKWEAKWGNTSYGKVNQPPAAKPAAKPAAAGDPYAHIDTSKIKFKDKYVTRTVDKLGLDNPDQAKLWAATAGINNLNSDSDIKTIKTTYEKLKGKLPKKGG